MDIASVSKSQISKILSQFGCKYATIEKIIEHGAPANDDGTLNLIEVTAWMIQEKHKK